MAPKMRVPRGFFSLSIRTTALRSNLTYEPSPRRVELRMRTTTQRTTSPALTSPPGEAFLTLAMIDVAEPGGAPLVARGAAAEDLEAHHFLGPGVVGHVEPRLHLDHGTDYPCADARIDWSGGPAPPIPVRRSPGRRGLASIDRLDSGRFAASSSPARACWAPWRTIRTIRHRLSFDSGRVSMISTMSPMCDCVRPRRARGRRSAGASILPYFGCGHEPLDLDPPGLVHLVGRHDPDLRLATAAGRRRLDAGLGSLGSSRLPGGLVSHAGLDCNVDRRCQAVKAGERPLALDLAEAEDRLDPGDLALRLDDLAGRLEPLGLALEPEPEEVLSASP